MARFEAGSRGQLGHALGLVVVKSLLLVSSLAVVSGWLGGAPWDEPSPTRALVLLGVLTLDVGAVVGLGLLAAGQVSPAALGWRAPSPRDLGLGIAGGLLCGLGLCALFGLWFGPGAVTGLLAQIAGWSPSQRALFAIIGLGAALGEETLFRGYLQPGLQRRLGPGAALVVTAAVFSLYHLQFHPVGLLGKVWLGLVYGALQQRTGQLWAPGLAHALVWLVFGAA